VSEVGWLANFYANLGWRGERGKVRVNAIYAWLVQRC
jgi:hypothetical protein